MKLAFLLFSGAIVVVPALARPKVAILETRRALVSTNDGKAAVAELHRKFDPDQARLKEQEAEIVRLRNAPEAASFKDRIDVLVTSHRRATEDARLRFDAEQKRVYKELSEKLMVVVKKYAKQKHYEVVLDESDPSSPIVWREDKNDITDKVIQLYDQMSLSTQMSGKLR
jgi:Skp family chaperone for outer membrane proteins